MCALPNLGGILGRNNGKKEKERERDPELQVKLSVLLCWEPIGQPAQMAVQMH